MAARLILREYRWTPAAVSIPNPLTQIEQEICSLKFGAKLSNPEIAQVLGLSAASVGACLCQGLQKIHESQVKSLP